VIEALPSAETDLPVLPYGMRWDRPAFKRACALARLMFDGYGATIILARDGRVWRSGDPKGRFPAADGASEHVIASGEPLWVEDLRERPGARDYPLVAGPPYLRFYAGVPIVLSDSSVLGALVVVAIEPRPFDQDLLSGLQDLAAFVADECDKARAEEALAHGGRKLSETRNVLAALIEVAPVSILMTDAQMRVVEVSAVWCSHIKVSREDAVGRLIYDLHPTFAGYREHYERVLGGESLRGGQVKWQEPDGTVRWLRTELTPWFTDDGEIGGLISVALDITETMEALRSSERAEQRVNLAAEAANLHVWELDFINREVVTAGVKDADLELFGRTLTFEELAADPYVAVHPSQRAAVQAEWGERIFEDQICAMEYRTSRPDREIWAASSVRMIKTRSGKPLRLIGAMQDITERKQAEIALRHAMEDAEAANKAKSVFLATMSHEIRTPMNGVLGMAQAMAADELNATQRERLEIIRQSGQTLLAILNDVLDLSKIEAGKLELELAEFDIEDVARGAHAAFTELANRKGLDFNLTVHPSARGAYMGDSTRLRQVVYNLVSNAVKFTEEGQVRVDVAREGPELCILVEDTGIGVAPDRLAKLFQKFEEADASTTRRYGGSGLGLAICRELVELMGGAIACQSELGHGTRFEVRVPLKRVGATTAPKPAPETAKTAGAPSDAGELRILAAEDNMVNQLVLKTLLHQAGIEPTMVDNGEAALEAWRAEEWDLILMDVQMPVMDGPTATRAIRAEEEASGRARTPIIALTANAMAHQVADYREAGMDDLVAKPIEIGVLFAAMERTLGEGEDAPERLAS
jgi:PAS domain S-box-containing protein